MFDLAREIRRIAQNSRARRGDGGGGQGLVSQGGAMEGISQAIDRFRRIGQEAVRLYNDAVGDEVLWIVDTPPIVLRTFLRFDDNRRGFSLLSRARYAVFLDNPPYGVLVLGRELARPGDQTREKRDMIQLIGLRIEGSGQGLNVTDSNGSPLDPAEIVALVVRWVSE